MKKTVVVSGGFGRVGSEIVSYFSKMNDAEIISLSRKDNFSRVVNMADLLVEFSSSPTAAVEHVNLAKNHGLSVVIGTTGFNKSQLKKIQSASKRIPIFLDSNMSLGMGARWDIFKQLSEELMQKVTIFESHSPHKKDSPSGTALAIKNELSRLFGVTAEIKSVRKDGVFGEHRILFEGNGEELEIRHRVKAVSAYVFGVLAASKLVLAMEDGLYSMRDVVI